MPILGQCPILGHCNLFGIVPAFKPTVRAGGGTVKEVAEATSVGDRASRRRKLQEAKEARELEEKTRATEQAAIKQTGAAREKEFTRLLGPAVVAVESAILNLSFEFWS